MNIQKIENLLTQIEKADVVVVDDSPYLHRVNVDSVATGTEDNEILMMDWDEEGQKFYATFTEQGLDGANFRDNLIMLEDHEGEPSTIRLYSLENCPVVKNW